MAAAKILEILDEVRQWLPEQRPINVFIHHNTLHSLESMKFEDAVEYAAARRGCAPYLPLEKYLSEFQRGRIDERHVTSALGEYGVSQKAVPMSFLGGRFNRQSIWRAAMQIPVCDENDAAVRWRLHDEQIDGHFFGLIERKCQGFFATGDRDTAEKRRPEASRQTAVDTMMIRLTAAFLDQGVSYWPIPHSGDAGFLQTAVTLLKNGDEQLSRGLRWFDANFAWQKYPLTDVPKLIELLLKQLQIPESEWEDFLFEEIMHLPGWAGAMDFAQKFAAGARAPNANLADFVAVRLLLRNSRLAEPKAEIFPEANAQNRLAQAYNLYYFLKALSISSAEFNQIPNADIASLCNELERFGDVARRRVWHVAFERHFRCQILDGVIANAALNKANGLPKNIKYQAAFCLDEREESFRRHIEEISPTLATYGTPGFFGMDMFYRGIHDQNILSLCPAVLTPTHHVREVATARAQQQATSSSNRLAILRGIAREVYDNSRLLFVGQILTLVGGFLAAIPLFLNIIFPRRSAQILERLKTLFPGHVETELHFEQTGSGTGGEVLGFKIEEMTKRVEGTLKAMGLVKEFAKLVFMFGHGSTSANNPHESAHDCGACSGSRGGPNARVFAAAANHPAVRESLRGRGIDIPAGTHFVGGLHDTSSDEVEFFDVQKIPASHQADFASAKKIFDEARMRNAHERCRRFEDAMWLSPRAALRHVETRAVDLSETRPEYGHATNAVCIVGRRQLTQHLFLDRRSFLISYDPTIDPNGDILAGVMGPIVPVCGGINLEYYFSFIDNQIYGCGTKLPHNVTGLIGIVDGHASDLRTGLPWQMVEIHEPMRLVILIEATRAIAEDMMRRNALLRLHVVNRWVQFGCIDPESGEVSWHEDEGFTKYVPLMDRADLPKVANSKAHYYGTLMHLPPVRIAAEVSPHVVH